MRVMRVMRVTTAAETVTRKIKLVLKSLCPVIRVLQDNTSNQSLDGFQGSQPFVTDKQFQGLSLDEIRQIIEQEKEELRKDYKEFDERKRLIKMYKRLVKTREKVRQGIDVVKERRKKKEKQKKQIKTFEEYFEECIKNKTIPSDTPPYLREALERAIREHYQGLNKEKSSLENFVIQYIIEGEPGLNPFDFLDKIYYTLKEFFTYHKNIKFEIILVCLMERQITNKDKGVVDLEEVKAYFRSKVHKNLKSTNEHELITSCYNKIIKDLDSFQANGSGWYFKEVVQLEIHTVEYNPANGSTYIPLPDWITNKKAIVNIQNKDEKCFLWCILRHLHPRKDNDSRIKDLKEYENSLNAKGITFPMKLSDITKFEKLNPELPGINVFSVDKFTFYPLRMAEKDCLNTIDLFLYEEDGVSHYTLIKNFHRLIKSQKTKSLNGKIFICKRCFMHFTKEELLQKHIAYCSNNETVSVKMPEAGTMLYFKNYKNQLPMPFVVYADFECFTKPMNTCKPNPKESFSYNYQKHEPSGFCIYIKGIVPKITFKPIIYTKNNDSDDIAEVFVNKLAEVTKSIYNKGIT